MNIFRFLIYQKKGSPLMVQVLGCLSLIEITV